MIEEVDETLRGLIRDEALKGSQVEVSFDAPTKDWAARRNAPTVNLYLYDIREDVSRRDSSWAARRDADGFVAGHGPAPRHYKLQYMLTAWTQRPEDEHRLLSSCLGTFLRHEALAPAEMAGSLAEQSLPGMISVGLPLGPDRSIADVWSALGGELKPSLDVVVTVPFVVGREVAAGAPVRELPRISLTRPEGDSEQVPGRPEDQLAAQREAARRMAEMEAGGGAAGARRAAMSRRGPLRPEDPPSQDETVSGGEPEDGKDAAGGRIFRIRGYPRP